MFGRLLVLFVTIPLIELYLLFRLNDWTGSAVTTIALVLLTGMLGAWLAKRQGLSTMRKIQQALSEGRLPGAELMDAAMILVAAALLITPGILTDAFGFSLLLPPCREVYRRWIRRIPFNVHVEGNVEGLERPTSWDDATVVEGTVHAPTREEDSDAGG